MASNNTNSDKRNALLAYKETLLEDIKCFEEDIEKFRTNFKNMIQFNDYQSSDSEDDFPLPPGPSIPDLQVQQERLQTCLQATQELTNLTVLQSEVNVLVEEPVFDGAKQIFEPGTWHEVTAECRIDLVPFTMTFYLHTPTRTFGSPSFRNLRVVPTKKSHESELQNSVLHTLTKPSDAVEVLRSYAAAYRSRRTTLAKLANKYANTLFMEPKPDGFLLKCVDLLEVTWKLENKWSPVAPFHHRMKFDLEYMDEAYIKIITHSHKQLLDPSIQTDERTLLLAKIIDTCLQAKGPIDTEESDIESRTDHNAIENDENFDINNDKKAVKDKEVMAPPKSLPKKSKSATKKRTLDDLNNKSAKKIKVTNEEQNIPKDGIKKNKASDAVKKSTNDDETPYKRTKIDENQFGNDTEAENKNNNPNDGTKKKKVSEAVKRGNKNDEIPNKKTKTDENKFDNDTAANKEKKIPGDINKKKKVSDTVKRGNSNDEIPNKKTKTVEKEIISEKNLNFNKPSKENINSDKNKDKITTTDINKPGTTAKIQKAKPPKLDAANTATQNKGKPTIPGAGNTEKIQNKAKPTIPEAGNTAKIQNKAKPTNTGAGNTEKIQNKAQSTNSNDAGNTQKDKNTVIAKNARKTDTAKLSDIQTNENPKFNNKKNVITSKNPKNDNKHDKINENKVITKNLTKVNTNKDIEKIIKVTNKQSSEKIVKGAGNIIKDKDSKIIIKENAKNATENNVTTKNNTEKPSNTNLQTKTKPNNEKNIKNKQTDLQNKVKKTINPQNINNKENITNKIDKNLPKTDKIPLISDNTKKTQSKITKNTNSIKNKEPIKSIRDSLKRMSNPKVINHQKQHSNFTSNLKVKESKIPQKLNSPMSEIVRKNMLRMSPRQLSLNSLRSTSSQDSNKQNMFKTTNIPRLLKKPTKV